MAINVAQLTGDVMWAVEKLLMIQDYINKFDDPVKFSIDDERRLKELNHRYVHKPPTDKEFNAALFDTLLGYAPPVFKCKKCGYPVIHGYCCNYCGDESPSDEPVEFEEVESKN